MLSKSTAYRKENALSHSSTARLANTCCICLQHCLNDAWPQKGGWTYIDAVLINCTGMFNLFKSRGLCQDGSCWLPTIHQHLSLHALQSVCMWHLPRCNINTLTWCRKSSWLDASQWQVCTHSTLLVRAVLTLQISFVVITFLLWGLNKLKAVLISSIVGLINPMRFAALAFLPFAAVLTALLFAGAFPWGSDLLDTADSRCGCCIAVAVSSVTLLDFAFMTPVEGSDNHKVRCIAYCQCCISWVAACIKKAKHLITSLILHGHCQSLLQFKILIIILCICATHPSVLLLSLH